MFTYSVWMPAKRKHDLTEAAKFHKAAIRGKQYAIKPYVHVRGKLIVSMDSDALAELKRNACDGTDKTELPLPAERNCFDGREWITEAEYKARDAQREFYKLRPDYFERTRYVNDPAQYDRDYADALQEWNEREIAACGLAEAA